MADKSPWDLAIVLLQLRKEERAEPARSGHGLHGLIISLLSVKRMFKRHNTECAKCFLYLQVITDKKQLSQEW